MRLLFDEYSNVILTIVGGLLILSVIIGSFFSTNITINHSEDLNSLNPIIEKIEIFECKDVLYEDENTDLLKDVKAFSNTGKDIKDKVIARIKDGSDDHKYVEYILKYNNDYKIKRSKLYIKEEEKDEDDV